MSSNGANEVTSRSAKEECKKEERQQVLCVADKQTNSLCVDKERWSRGESSGCPGANCSQLSVGFRFDCDCDDKRWSRGESLCDNERWSRGESSVCPGVNSVGVCSDCDHRRTTTSAMEHGSDCSEVCYDDLPEAVCSDCDNRTNPSAIEQGRDCSDFCSDGPACGSNCKSAKNVAYHE